MNINAQDHVISVDDVTVCMIVLNEADFLPATLRAVSPHINRFVIADMGSSDGTPDIIKSMLGDKVRMVQFSPQRLVEEGYAAARNFSASFATTPWILMLDADEVLVSGIDGGGIRVDRPLARTAVATIKIDHLKKPETVIPFREVRSTSLHHRLYRNEPGISWAGYIHEDVSIGNGTSATEIAHSVIEIDHYTEFKDAERNERKREMYFWMLLRGFRIPALRHGTNAYWYDKFVPEHLEMVRAGAKAFAERSGFDLAEIDPGGSPWAALGADHETMHSLAQARTLHSVPSRPWTENAGRAVWCEWNHQGERARTLQSMIDYATAMNWPRFIPPRSTCIDIGAHSGDTAIPMGLFSFDRQSQSRGVTVAIEPNPELFPLLTLNLDLNAHIADFRAMRAAITREDTPAVTLADHGNDNCNGGILDNRFSTALLTRLEQAAQVTYEAPGITLQTLLHQLSTQLDPQSVRFVKIDCEGYDKEIVRSAHSVLDALKPVLFVEWFDWFTPEDDEDFFSAIAEVGYTAWYPDSLTQVDRTKRSSNLMCIHGSSVASLL